MSDANIDPLWLAREVAKVTTDLERSHPDSGPGVVRAAVDLVTQQLAGVAKIPNYLPILIRRAADEMLRGVLGVPPGVAERVAAAAEPV